MVIHWHAPDICHADAMAGYLSNQGTRLFDHSRCRPPPATTSEPMPSTWDHGANLCRRDVRRVTCVWRANRGAWRMTLHLGTRSEGDLSAIRRRWLRLVLRRWPRTRTPPLESQTRGRTRRSSGPLATSLPHASCHGEGAHGRSERCRRSFVLPYPPDAVHNQISL